MMDYYQKAIKESGNELTAPLYLGKAAQVAQEQKNYKQALEYLERIKTDYPKSEEATSVEMRIAQVNALMNL